MQVKTHIMSSCKYFLFCIGNEMRLYLFFIHRREKKSVIKFKRDPFNKKRNSSVLTLINLLNIHIQYPSNPG